MNWTARGARRNGQVMDSTDRRDELPRTRSDACDLSEHISCTTESMPRKAFVAQFVLDRADEVAVNDLFRLRHRGALRS
jgi:hypothetical protein